MTPEDIKPLLWMITAGLTIWLISILGDIYSDHKHRKKVREIMKGYKHD